MNTDKGVHKEGLRMNEEKIELIQYITTERLQEIQDSFTAVMGMGTTISDADGSALSQSVAMCDFCKFTRVSRIGSSRCRQCDAEGSEKAFQEGRVVSYECHAGLIDFVAPIIVAGQRVGCVSAGQVRTGPLDEEKVRQTAKDINVNPEMYLALARNTPMISEEELQTSMNFVNSVTGIISDMANKQYELEKAKDEVEYAAKLKADFLANMSHEIRTPMNGVIGMAELALREELSDEAREYINQIKVSGKTLLTIINDILDFSKIESGKMDIIIDEYEPLSIVSDVANILETRIGDKDLELILDVDCQLPAKLYGDCVRIKQVLLNLANNAVKFTSSGYVRVSLGMEQVTEDEILFKVSIKDTGIGIAPEDLRKLFVSFQQVDSKRNRQVEGTGLGLAISKQLVELMGGEIGVESTHGEGSTFWFSIPQKICKVDPCIFATNKEALQVVCIGNNTYVQEQLQRDIECLGGTVQHFAEIRDVPKEILASAKYLFIEDCGADTIEKLAKSNDALTIVVIEDYKCQTKYEAHNIEVIKKPVYALNLANLFNGIHAKAGVEENADFVFTAPDAHILVVDDNEVNLTVAAGLLQPLQMKIDTALSGKTALEMIEKNQYDLIFMDHMMPELDGVETTRMIRRFHPTYNEVPIVALTANIVEGTKEMFIREGMNDFVPKPIEIKTIVAKLHKWLPLEKQLQQDSLETGVETASIQIEQLDTQYAMNLLKTEALYMSVLKDYYKMIDRKASLIQELFVAEDWGKYTIEVHALKSASRQIGALELADLAAELEKAGNARDVLCIQEKTSELLTLYTSYKEILRPICDTQEEQGEKKIVDESVLKTLLEQLTDALENLDLDEMERIGKQISSYAYEDSKQNFIDRLCSAIEEIDMDTIAELLSLT